jgi:hypothetical protein
VSSRCREGIKELLIRKSSVGGWLLLHGKTEVGTVVAFISGLNRMNDPWGDLVNYFRDLTNAGVKYRMIASALDKRAAEPVGSKSGSAASPGHSPVDGLDPLSPAARPTWVRAAQEL